MDYFKMAAYTYVDVRMGANKESNRQRIYRDLEIENGEPMLRRLASRCRTLRRVESRRMVRQALRTSILEDNA